MTTKSRQMIWRRLMDDQSLESAAFIPRSDGFEIGGTVLIAEAGEPLRVEYTVVCDGDSRTRRVVITQTFRGERRTLRLVHGGAGTWTKDGLLCADLAGCTDVDLGVSPSTNAMPIRRLDLAVGARATIQAAWVRFPSLDVVKAEQAYERLGPAQYRYESVASGFRAVLDVDDQGFPTEYAGIWRRIASRDGDSPDDTATAFAGALVAPAPHLELGQAADDFAWLVGCWRGEVRDYDQEGAVRESPGEWVFGWVLDGRALQDVLIVPARGAPEAAGGAGRRFGSTIRRFDQVAGIWRIVWVNPVSGSENHLAGRRTGDRIVLQGEDNGQAIRWSFTDIQADSFRWLGENLVGEQWVRAAEFHFRRVGT